MTKTMPLVGMTITVGRDGGARLLESRVAAEMLGEPHEDDRDLRTALEAVERVVLAHACAGVDIESMNYQKGVETAIEAIGNRYA